jgi:hypothetical protein
MHHVRKEDGGVSQGTMSKYARKITPIVDSPAQTGSKMAVRGSTVLS